MARLLFDDATSAISDLLSTDQQPPDVLPRDRRHAISVEWDPGLGNQVEWFISGETEPELFPPGTSINAARIADDGIPIINRTVDIENHRASVADVTFRIADIGGAASGQIADKWANRNSGRNAIVRYYVHDATFFNAPTDLVATFVLDAPSYPRGAVDLHCTDIAREAIEQNVLDPASWRIVTSIPDNGNVAGAPTQSPITEPTQAGELSARYVVIYGPDPALHMVEHSDAYPELPGETVLMLHTDMDETIAVDEPTAIAINGYDCYRCRIRRRGVFRSRPEAIEVDASDDAGVAVDALPSAEEVPYYVEPAPSMLLGLLTRELIDGRLMAEAHTHGLDAFADSESTAEELIEKRYRWIDVRSLAGTDLGYPLVIRAPGKAKLLKLIESQILQAMGGVLIPDRHGRLAYRQIPDLTPTSPHSGVLSAALGTLDEASMSALKPTLSNRADPIKIKSGWDWRTETYVDQPTYRRLTVAEIVNGDTEPLELEMKLLGSGFQSDQQRHAIARRKAAIMAYPTLAITVTSPLTRAVHGLLDVVSLQSDKVRDAHTGLPIEQPLNRSFLVVGENKNYRTGEARYTLLGTTARPQDVSSSFLEQHLPDEWYDQFPRLLDNLTRPGGSVGYSNGELSGSAHRLPPGTYSHVGNLTIRPGFRADPPPGVYGDRYMIVVRGTLEIQEPNPWGAEGNARAYGGDGGTMEVPARPGGAGLVGGGSTGQPIRLRQIYQGGAEQNSDGERFYNPLPRARVQLGRPLTFHWGVHEGSMPSLNLAVTNGELVGLPSLLMGAGGHGAPPHQRETDSRSGLLVTSQGELVNGGGRGVKERSTLEAGGNGARGGMAIVYVSRAGGFTGSGGSVTSGGSVQSVGAAFDGPVGMPGWPGVGVWLIDGGQQKSLPDPSRFTCAVGSYSHTGLVVEDDGILVVDSGTRPGAQIRGPVSPAMAGQDVWRQMTLVAHVPRPEVLSEESAPRGPIQAFFETQIDGAVTLYVSDVTPGNANLDDAWITQSQIDLETAQPQFRILTRSGWRDFVWGTDPHQEVYAALIALNRRTSGTRIVNAPNGVRPSGLGDGNAWRNGLTGQVWIWRESGVDELFVDGEYQVGDGRTPDPRFVRQRAEITRQGYGEQWNVVTDLPGTMYVDDPPTGSTGGGGGGTYSLPMPAALQALVYSATQVELIVGHPGDTTGVTGFEIRRNGTLIATVTLASSSYLDTTEALTTYSYVVRSIGGGERSADTAPQTVTTPAGSGGGGGGGGTNALDPPTGLSALRYGSTSGELLWTPSSDTDVTGYEVRREGSLVSTLSGRATSSYYTTSLTPSTAHDFDVRSINGAGDRSDDVSATMPSSQ